MNRKKFITASSIALLFIPLTVFAQANDAARAGESVFNAKCKSCHDPAVERAPGRAELAIRSRADIARALVSGVMQPMAKDLSPNDIEAVATFLTTAPTVANEDARRRATPPPVGVDRMCESHPPIQVSDGDWASMGISASASRFQRKPGLSAADIPKLKL
ncbi:MAG TPA: cytochrome c, partial [Steroidobacteraceae bacterium]|nr:cytochrome c [Steroidobacteraceae bacterium]